MTQTKPTITGTTHTLPFDKLSAEQFERLCLWLVQREGYERAQHLGAKGSEQGRDITAWREGQLWAFQCKRVVSFGPSDALKEVEKVIALPEEQQPVGLIFLVTCDVNVNTRQRALDRCAEKKLACDFWVGTELDEKVKRHRDIVQEFFQVVSPYTQAELSLPTPEQVQAHRAALRERLEMDACARWGGMSVYIQEEGTTLPIQASPYETARLGPRQNLLELLRAAGRLLVLGEPGSGKTVALERLAWELCGGPEPTVPLLVRLFQYDGTPLAEWARPFLQETGHLRLDDDRALDAFLHEGQARCIFLFDGLNEVPPGHRERLVGELVRWIKAHPHHPTVLTSRPQDELWRRLWDEVGRAVVIQPIDDDQAQAYLIAHLGQDDGRTLYAQLDRRLKAMARTPLVLWLIKEAGKAGESLPGNRGELYTRFVSRMLRRDTDRRMDAEIPERVKRQALADLAYYMGRVRRLTCPHDEAVQVVTRRLDEARAETVVAACARHGLLAGEETLWFAPHQTVQEHFAALALLDLAGDEWRQGAWERVQLTGRELLTRQPQGLAALAADDWWAETFVQLAGMTDDADRLARTVARANPWLGWWCVEEGRDVQEATLLWVEDRTTQLLRSRRVADRRRAVRALAEMQSERTIEPLFQAAADPDAEIANLAVQALVGMGEAARTTVAAALRGADPRLWRAALRYLGVRQDDRLCTEIPVKLWEEFLGQPLVWVPPGPFLMGSDKTKDPQADDDELPQHTVTLPGYWIGRFPVTEVCFRTFVETSGYRPVRDDPLKGPDDHPVVYVTWHDIPAYCRWLAEKTGLPVTLPSEAEWEKAARGTEGRIYPWGDEWDPGKCNWGWKDTRGTTPVGRYSPQGDSPYGCADMAGNVWEWTRSDHRRYPYGAADGRENLKAGDAGLRVLRGGSYVDAQRYVRCAYRSGYHAYYWGSNFGFRVVVAPITEFDLTSLRSNSAGNSRWSGSSLDMPDLASITTTGTSSHSWKG